MCRQTSPRAAAQVVPAPSRERDPRLDLFRGLALATIFVDHVLGTPFAHLTYRNFGFTDAADVFVFLAGYSSALAFGGRRETADAMAATRRVFRRCLQIYGAHVALTLSAFAMVAAHAATFGDDAFLEYLNLGPLRDDFAGLLPDLLALTYLPSYLNILPLYVALLLFLPLLLGLLRVDRMALLGLSVLVYLLAKDQELNLPADPKGWRWVLNPLTWQLLFVLGLLCGHEFGLRRHQLPRSPGLAVPALAVVSAAAVMTVPCNPLVGLRSCAEFWHSFGPAIDKTGMGPLRLMHLMAMAYIVACLLPRDAEVLERGLVRRLRAIGRHSLPIYCAGTLLSLAGSIVLIEAGHSPALQATVIGAGLLALAALGGSLDRWGRAMPTTACASLPAGAPAGPYPITPGAAVRTRRAFGAALNAHPATRSGPGSRRSPFGIGAHPGRSTTATNVRRGTAGAERRMGMDDGDLQV